MKIDGREGDQGREQRREGKRGKGRVGGRKRKREGRRGVKKSYYAPFPMATANIFSFCYMPKVILNVSCFISFTNPHGFIN